MADGGPILMPYVHIDLTEGRTAEQKQALSRAITEAFVAHAGVKKESVWVVFRDVAASDWAVGGEMLDQPRPSADLSKT
jgi:4-oxalocrotonate tautomerase